MEKKGNKTSSIRAILIALYAKDYISRGLPEAHALLEARRTVDGDTTRGQVLRSPKNVISLADYRKDKN